MNELNETALVELNIDEIDEVGGGFCCLLVGLGALAAAAAAVGGACTVGTGAIAIGGCIPRPCF